MRIAWWQPHEQAESTFEQPYLEAPSPLDYLPFEPPQEEPKEEERPRVIIIDI